MMTFTYGQHRADNLRGSVATRESALSDAVCYDLFRRAIEQRDADAWADIGRHYRGLLAAWAAQSSARRLIAEQPEDIADQAFARAWAALSSAHFSAFPHIASLLAYLRTCVRATVIDHARDQSGQQRAVESIEATGISAAPEHAVLEELDRTELWRLILEMTSSIQE